LAKKCPNCHSDQPENTRFCSDCGTSLLPAADTPAERTKTIDFAAQGFPRGHIFAERYEIIEMLGRGGMGSVYRVEDTQLKEEVALKVINPDVAADKNTIERFRNELKLSRQIAHRNVCKMYYLGESKSGPYIVMEYVAGESLRNMIRMSGPMGLGTTLKIIRQVAEGLSEAHRMGVVHRDLKPSNIMIDRAGNARIMDFGIARSAKIKGITRAGVIVGTPGYMSPEQVEGQEPDQRSDIYSLAVIMYEMTTGRLPFAGDTPLSIGVKQRTEIPPEPKTVNPQIPEDLNHLIMTCLDLDREKRCPTAEALFSELIRIEKDMPTAGWGDTARLTRRESGKFPEKQRRLVGIALLSLLLLLAGYAIKQLIRGTQATKEGGTSAAPAAAKLIAILPFDDISPGKDNAYFSDGLTDEIIGDLSKIGSLRVFSRTSAMILKSIKKDVQSMGKEFGINYVLEGSVRKADKDIRVTVQLTDTSTGVQLSTEKYDGTMDDVFKIQEKLSRLIVDTLKLTLTPEETAVITSRPINNVLAYDLYLKARQEIWRWSGDALERALKYLQNGLDIVGPNVLLYAGIGYVHWQLYNSGIRWDENTLRQVEEEARKIFQLEPDSPYGHFLLGLFYTYGNNQKSVRSLKRVLAKDPNNPDALFWLTAVYGHVGKTEAAVPLVERLLMIDPFNPINHSLPGWLRFFNGQFAEALPFFQKMYDMTPDNPASRGLLAATLIYDQQFDKAIALIDQLVKDEPKHIFTQLGLFLKYALQQKRREALSAVTEELALVSGRDITFSWLVAAGYAILGEKETAMDWLERAVNLGFINYPFLSKHDPFFKNIRGEKRFLRLMDRVRSEWERFEV